MTDELVIIEEHDDGVALLRLNRPPMNPLSCALLGELEAAAGRLSADPTVRAVVVAGSEKAFAAGADINELEGDGAARRVGVAFRAAFDAVAGIPLPVVAAIRGYALGGGFELAMACDLRVAADSARVGQPEILLGIIPGAGGTQRLTRLVGLSRAKDLVWSGRQVRSDEALAIGLVDKVVPADEVEDAAIRWAASFAGGATVAMSLAKRAIDGGIGGPLSAGLDLELECFVKSFESEDAKIGIAAYLEHGPGKARFTGR